MKIKAVLFDIDGVLVDSEPVISDVAVEVFKEFGLTVDPKVFLPYLGAGDKFFIDGISSYYNFPLDFDKTNNRIYEKYADAIKRVDPISGVVKFLDFLKKEKVKIALASSAPSFKIDMNIEALGKDKSFFDAIVSGDDIKENKPSPEIYLLAAEKLNEKIENCLVIEDSINGVISGVASKAKVLGITTSFSESRLRELGSFAAFEDFCFLDGVKNLKEFNSLMNNLDKDDRVAFGAVKCFLAREYPLGEKQLIDNAINMATQCRNNSYSPYSKYKVGAAIISASTNSIYVGTNVENASYGATICAERGALMAMLANEGPTGISHIIVVTDDNPPAPPCALCLQALSEFSREDTKVHLCDISYAKNGEGVHKIMKFKDLLPHPFIFD